jgi:hypothetical protein
VKFKTNAPAVETVPVLVEAAVPSPQLIAPVRESPAAPVQVRLAETFTPVCPADGALSVQLGGPTTTTAMDAGVTVAANCGWTDVSAAVALTANPALLRVA